MPWRPTAGGPNNLRELYHWVWNNLVDAGENITGEGGDITHVSTTGRSDPNQHPTAAITGLDAEQSAQDAATALVQTNLDDFETYADGTYTQAGYGGINLLTPTGITLGGGVGNWTTLPADNDRYTTPIGVIQSSADDAISVTETGAWTFFINIVLTHDISQSGRDFFLRVWNFIDGVQLGSDYTYSVGRNQAGSNISVTIPVEVPAGAINKGLQIQVGGTADVFSGVVVDDYSFFTQRISSPTAGGGGGPGGTPFTIQAKMPIEIIDLVLAPSSEFDFTVPAGYDRVYVEGYIRSGVAGDFAGVNGYLNGDTNDTNWDYQRAGGEGSNDLASTGSDARCAEVPGSTSTAGAYSDMSLVIEGPDNTSKLMSYRSDYSFRRNGSTVRLGTFVSQHVSSTAAITQIQIQDATPANGLEGKLTLYGERQISVLT